MILNVALQIICTLRSNYGIDSELEPVGIVPKMFWRSD